MPTYYWISTTPGANASDYTQWSQTPAGPPLPAWPGSSPDASDDFFFDDQSTANCNWDIAAVQSIRQDTTNLYTGIITFATNVALKGLILNGEITDGGTGYALTFSGTPLTALDDASSKSRYVLNGQKAKHGSGSTLLYKIQPASADVHLDNGPYNKLTIDTNTMTLAYNVPTASTHDNADDGTIHIKSDFVATAGGGFLRDTAPDASEDTAVKIKFDTTNITYTNETMDFVMATAFFRGVEIPTTGAQTYGSSTAGFTAKHYGLVIFASSDGELSTIPNGLQLDCYSLEIKAGARLRVQSGSGTPAIIKSQTQPKVKGVWSFESLNSHVFTSPRSNPVSSVANGGTGLSSVEANALLMGNSSTPMRPLVELPPGTNGYVLTMVGGTPAWAAASGGGGGGTPAGSNTQVQFNDGGAFGASADLTWDDTAKELYVDGKLTVTGLIDPTGLELAAQAANPGGVAANTLWLDSGDSNRAKIGSSKVIQAGDNVGELADDGTYATAAQGAAADAALPTTGGTMTGEIEGTTITLNAVPADPATDDKVRLGESGATQNMLRIQTNDGYLDIGPNNSGYSHFYTNRNTFYMNKPLVVDGGGEIFAYNDGLKLGTGSSVSSGTVAINVAHGSTNVEVVGTLRQGAVASAVLVADGNGDIIGASNLQDIAYLSAGQAQIDAFSPILSGAAWGPPGPPPTIQEAIDRIASALANPGFVIGTPIP